MAERKMTPFTNEHFTAFCLNMVGQPYWYGTCLYKCTESLRSRKADQYPSHYGSSRTSQFKQDIAAKKVCADCIGGAKGYAWTNGGQGVLEAIGTHASIPSKYCANGCPDKGANGMFSYAKSKGVPWGTIDTLPEVVGLALHTNGHVGYYVGDGYAVEWRGFHYGCVKTRVAERAWKYWYRLPFIQYDEATGAAVADGDGDEVQKTDSSTEPPSDASDTDVPSKVVIVSQSGRVNIRTGNSTSYGRITLVAAGATYPYVATAANGWHAVEVGKQVGWVSGDFSRVI